MQKLPFMNHDAQNNSVQYLEDIATGYWFSETLFAAVEMGIFSCLEPSGKTLPELAAVLQLDPESLQRFLLALNALGLISQDGETWFNMKIARRFLIKEGVNYQGDSILWRKFLVPSWQGLNDCLEKGTRTYFPPADGEEEMTRRFRRYTQAMDCMARQKAGEMLPFFAGVPLTGNILDVGSGAGAVSTAFLEAFPFSQAALLDLAPVLDEAEELNGSRYGNRVCFCPANILESWPVPEKEFDLVILSNIIHAYGEGEITQMLKKAAACLKPEGFLLIHDFFLEHQRSKASLFDLNMLVNTFNGRVYEAAWVRNELKKLGLVTTEMLPLESDTALVIAAGREDRLGELSLDKKSQLAARIRHQGFQNVYLVPAEMVHVPDWTPMRCRFGCSSFGKPHCPPHSPTPDKTRDMLGDYTCCLLLEGAPPTGDFQRQVLRAEKEAFRAGFYKAFAFWAGPCSLCAECSDDLPCRNTREARPSMEASGIDVFETVRRAGISLGTLAERDDFVKYFAILLLE